MNALFKEMFERLLEFYGPQAWWPGESPFEVMVGAILTQNTNWSNVETAIHNLKTAQVLSPQAMLKLPPATLAELIRPAGYFNVKTKRLKAFLEYFANTHNCSIDSMKNQAPDRLREELLQVKGIGKETADSILLYALAHPIFVIDTYTYRIFTRHNLIQEESDYDELQELATSHIPESVERYNEFHALLVMVGKDYCKPKPKCDDCPLNGLNW